MNADDPEDRQFILMAAQLCRLIIRALEIKGFRDLQKELGDFTRVGPSDIEGTLVRTGRLLGTLRWRLVLWELSPQGFPGVTFMDRVKKITNVLYSWFLFAKRRLPEGYSSNSLQGSWSRYMDIGIIWDDFPYDESSEGFRTWLRGPRKQLKDVYSLSQVPSMSAPGSIEKSILPATQAPFSAWQMPLAPRKNYYYDPASGVNYEF